MSTKLRIFIHLNLVLLLSACSSVEYPPDKSPRMLVANETTPFYLHGPAQGNGADRTLVKGDEVQVLRKDFGYSYVQLSDGMKGYVANEELVIAPPQPHPSPTPKTATLINRGPGEKLFPEYSIPGEETNVPVAMPNFRY